MDKQKAGTEIESGTSSSGEKKKKSGKNLDLKTAGTSSGKKKG